MNNRQNDVSKEVAVDWEKIKKIICSFESQIELLCNEVPEGYVKIILCGIAALMGMLCKKI